jgi:hypothetical protein
MADCLLKYDPDITLYRMLLDVSANEEKSNKNLLLIRLYKFVKFYFKYSH